jgi:hypothetical protein
MARTRFQNIYPHPIADAGPLLGSVGLVALENKSADQTRQERLDIQKAALPPSQRASVSATSVVGSGKGLEYLRERYGMSEVLRMLRNIGSGVKPELALRQSTGMDYSTLEQRMGEYLAKSSGN